MVTITDIVRDTVKKHKQAVKAYVLVLNGERPWHASRAMSMARALPCRAVRRVALVKSGHLISREEHEISERNLHWTIPWYLSCSVIWAWTRSHRRFRRERRFKVRVLGPSACVLRGNWLQTFFEFSFDDTYRMDDDSGTIMYTNLGRIKAQSAVCCLPAFLFIRG